MVTIEDDEIIRSVRAGRRDDYAQLVRKYQLRVRRLCVAVLADAALADDAAQEIFLKAYRGLKTFRGQAAFSTWLYRIAANHCADVLRRRAREPTESWEALIEQHGEQIERLLARSPDPKASVAAADLVRKVLSHLTPADRLLLTLREAEGLSYQELAETLRCSVDAIKARLRRARQRLLKRTRHVLPPADV